MMRKESVTLATLLHCLRGVAVLPPRATAATMSQAASLSIHHPSSDPRDLMTLVMEESTIVENDGEWLHELALENTVLENLNFYMTDLVKVASADLELIAKNCASLVSMKITDCDIIDLVGVFRFAAALEDFCGGSFSSPPEEGEDVSNEQLEL
ncbi:Uncharacterized protein Fot_33188 [Forsythia ovata]|uniref:Uncharacterized protein n=1 Tax=Forsythia ovata TaxID=205694 RepID=A0ABD1T9X8_9LAMI